MFVVLSKRKLQRLMAERDREIYDHIQQMIERNNAVLRNEIPSFYRVTPKGHNVINMLHRSKKNV